MPTTTTRLKLPRPLGTDNFNLANQQALIDAIESNAAQRDDYTVLAPYAAVTGVANTYAATLTPAPTTYTEGMAVAIKINTANTGASTLNVNGLGAKSIRKPDGSDVTAGELVAGSVYTLRYNGTVFTIQGLVPATDYMRQGIFGTTSGSANAYTLAPSPALSSYTDFLRITVVFQAANTAPSTINISGLGTRGLKKSDGTDFSSGELKTGMPYTFVLTGSNFIRQGEGSGAKLPGWAKKDFWMLGRHFIIDTRSEAEGVYVNGVCYYIGGRINYSTPEVTGRNYAYNTKSDTWQSRTSMPSIRRDFGCAANGNDIYAIGGDSGTDSLVHNQKNECYSISSDTWSTKANMPTKRKDLVAVTMNNLVYALGGFDYSTSASTNKNEAYDPITNTWSTKTPIPRNTKRLLAAFVDNKLYVFLGYETPVYYYEIYIYDPLLDSWTKKSDLIGDFPRGIGVIGKLIYAVRDASNRMITQVYDPLSNTWTDCKPPNVTYREFTTFSDGEFLYLLGGYSGSYVNDEKIPVQIYVP